MTCCILIEERLRLRRRADAVRLEFSSGADASMINLIVTQEQIRTASDEPPGYSEIYQIDGPVDLTGLTTLLKLPNRDELRDPPFVAETPRGLRRERRGLAGGHRSPRCADAPSV